MLKKILIVFLIFSMFIAGFVGAGTFADDGAYNAVIAIGGQQDGNVGSVFKSEGLGAQGPWAPGHSASGVLRVVNQYGSGVDIKNLGMNMTLSRNNETLPYDNTDAMDFMKNMKIKVEYKNPLKALLNGILYDGDFSGFSQSVNCQLSLMNGSYVDLVYTITMDKESEVNVAGINGMADFTVNIEGNSSKRTGHSSTHNAGVPSNSDIKDSWAHDCIQTLIEKGVIKGYPDGKVKPENNITRAEAAAIIGRALKLDGEKKAVTGYADNIPEWCSGWVEATTRENIFEGYPNKKFMPDQYISREEMTKVLIKGFRKKLVGDQQLSFTDKGRISKWALEYIKIGVESKAIEGYPDNSFKPLNNITRAEAFTLICKLMGWHEEHSVAQGVEK